MATVQKQPRRKRGNRQAIQSKPACSATQKEAPLIIGASKQAELIAGRLTLEHAPAGRDLCVTAVRGENGNAQRLRELGMFEGQTVRILSPGNPLICQVGDCRLGMCRRLADCILVQPVASQ